MAHLKRVKGNLVDFFGKDRAIDSISAGDADDFRQHLRETMAPNTVARICGRAKQFFRYAVRKRHLAESPFADMKKLAVQPVKEREFFVTREMAEQVLEACPDPEWCLLFALARWGGLRCPSETLSLTWCDVDWERGRIRVVSPKTEHHEGKGSRSIPIVAELRPYLEAVYDAAADGTVHVITRYRDPNSNLRTQLERIIRKAGLEPWGKPWQNLRSTRDTELAETYPIHVVCAWIGDSEAVARAHYLQVTDEHFEAAHNPAQQAPEMDGTTQKAKQKNPGIAGVCHVLPTCTGVQAPRAVLSLNRGFVELGTFTRNKLRQTPTIDFYPWNAPPPSTSGQPKAAKTDRDPLRLARYYQSHMDSGKFESRAALARHLGVSRARVTQVLNRLKDAADLRSDAG